MKIKNKNTKVKKKSVGGGKKITLGIFLLNIYLNTCLYNSNLK